MDVRLFLRRFVTVGLGASLSVALLTAFLAWVALQAEWVLPDPASLNTPSVVFDRNGDVIARFTSEQDRRFISLDDVTDVGWQAVVASEDIRFFEHGGVDPTALIRAVVRNVVTGQIAQGASTLTQQYVRNGLEGVGRDRTIVRKIKEAVLSVQYERDFTKQEILERYLNTVYFGEGAYGIEAAALTFFGVSSSELTAKQAALLTQGLPGPSFRNARVDPDGADGRANLVLGRMVEAGYLTADEANTARDERPEIRARERPPVAHPYFVEYVRKQLASAYGAEAVLTGGLQVHTTIDPDAQAALEAAVAQELPQQDGDNADVEAAAVAIDPRTGDILAIYGGRDHDTNQFDLATQGDRQNGSTFKPLTFVAALEQGIAPTQRYASPKSIRITADECADYDGPPWEPSGGPGGGMSMQEGMINSVNTVFAQVACDVGGPAIVDVAHRLGVRNDIGRNPAVALGTPSEDPTDPRAGTAGGASVLDMASAFATLANDGVYCPARSVLAVTDALGEPRPAPVEVTVVPNMTERPRALTDDERAARPEGLADRDNGGCTGALDADVARVTTKALQQVVARTTGRRADLGRPQAGKTGTSNNEVDAWFVGYTPDLAIAVWVGHRNCGGVTEDNPTDTRCVLRNIEGFSKVQGGTIPAKIWKAAAEVMLADVPPLSFLEPGELDERGRRLPGPGLPEPAPSPTEEPQPTEEPSPSEPTTDGGETDGGDGDTGGPGLPTGGDPGGTGGDGDEDGGDTGGCIPLVTC